MKNKENLTNEINDAVEEKVEAQSETKAEAAPEVESKPEPETAAKPDTSEPTKTAEPEKDWREYLPKLLTVTPSPHIRTADTTRSIMLDVCIALMPALIWGIFTFGWRALTLTLIAIGTAVLSEFVYTKLMKKPTTILDCSAIVTGLLIALNLPVSVPLWMPAIGSIFAIIVVKQLFGGIGRNFVNPALAARVFLFAWPARMGAEAFTAPGVHLSPFAITPDAVDTVASATPLASLKAQTLPSQSMVNMVLGWEAGCIGEVSALMLAAGFVYLLFRRVITWHIPVFYIGTVAIISFIAFKSTLPFVYMGAEIFSGGLFLGAIFMATDYATSPVTERGRIIYAIGCGLLTVFIRFFGGYAEGVSFAILIMNLLVWYLDRYTKPIRFGGKASEKSGK